MARTTALNKIEETLYQPTFYKVIQGGMSAGKTFAIITILVGYCESYPDSLVTILGLSYPHLATGAIRDFTKIMKETNRWEESRWNSSAHLYRFANGSTLEFLSVDKMSSRGPRRDVLFVNEANGISYEVFNQLASRTRDFAIIDYNPSAKFWAHEELVEKMEEKTSFLILTYLDNEALSTQERENIESRKPKPGEEPSNFWIVYGLGQIGSLEGNIYSGWESLPAEEIKKRGRLVRYGLDFGFSNDETAMVGVYEMEDGKVGLIEMIYKKGLLGSQYGDALRKVKTDSSVLIVADAARPEIIAEIKKEGFRCIGADKSPGSVLRGIDRVSQKQIVYAGENLEREYLSYAWRQKRSGEILDEPQDGFDHCLPYSTKVDTVRGQKPIGQLVGTKGWLYAEDGKIRYYRNVRQTGIEPILKITLSDGRTIRCSSEHPIYTLNRGIVPANLLNQQDVIQCVSFGKGQGMAQVRQGKGLALEAWQGLVARERAARKNMCPLWERLLYTRCWDKISLLLWKLQNARKNKTAKRASRIIGASESSQKVRHMWKNVLFPKAQRANMFAEMPKQEDIHPTKIEADGVEPVYCLDVYDTSNFSIEGGIIVSNCLDATRYAIDDMSKPRFDF